MIFEVKVVTKVATYLGKVVTFPRDAAGQEPKRWHWAYGGTCFRLDQRVESDGGRARILSRGTVMTRGGVDELREQLFAEAQRHGLA